ncbi:MAG: peptidyl-prolyl cis-trans isomerase [Helicobacteraceae bacterium]|nr:peptidyl-prolyl cis-trans isomerase [Helicobacteraceae bacterium]
MIKLFLTLLFTVTSYAQLVDGVAIVVENHPITLYEIEKETQRTNQTAQNVARTLIRKKLEEMVIRQRQIVVTRDEVNEDIRSIAQRNNITIMQLFESVESSQKLTTKEFKEKIKEKLLSQKLYQSISYSKMTPPTLTQKKEYYEIHSNEFSQPEEYEVIIYHSDSQEKLKEKTSNPMFFSPEVSSREMKIKYTQISPQLVDILNKTPEDSFSPIFPSPNGGFDSFYMKNKAEVTKATFEEADKKIENMIMAQKRADALDDFFERLRVNTQIKFLRLPK